MASAPRDEGRPFEERVANAARGVFDRSLLRAGERGDVGPLGEEGHANPGRERGTERFVADPLRRRGAGG